MRHWFFHPSTDWPWLYVGWAWLRYVPQPRWAQKLYYRFSFLLWGHPSNYHWKRSPGCSCILSPGRRCLWCGCYQDDHYSVENLRLDRRWGMPIPNPQKKKEYYEHCAKKEIEDFKNLQWVRKPLRWFDRLKGKV